MQRIHGEYEGFLPDLMCPRWYYDQTHFGIRYADLHFPQVMSGVDILPTNNSIKSGRLKYEYMTVPWFPLHSLKTFQLA